MRAAALLVALVCSAALAFDAGGAVTGTADVTAVLPDGTPVTARALLPGVSGEGFVGSVRGGEVRLELPDGVPLDGYTERRPEWYCQGQSTPGLATALLFVTARPPGQPELALERTETRGDGTQVLDTYLYANRDGTVVRTCQDGTLERLDLKRGWNAVRFTFYPHGTLVTNAPARLLPYVVRAVTAADGG